MFLFVVYVSVLNSACIISVYADLPDIYDTVYKTGELIVRFAPKDNGIQRNAEGKNQVLSSLGGAVLVRDFTIVPGLALVKLPSGKSVQDSLGIFNKSNDILYAQPNYYLEYTTIPNDTRFEELWGLHNTGQTDGMTDADIDASDAWDIYTDSDVIVAVIDTGIDYNHPDLANNMWTNEAECALYIPAV